MSVIPDSIYLKVFEYLTITDLCVSVRPVCHRWNLLSYDLSLWKKLSLAIHSEVITTWGTFIKVFSKVLPFVDIIDFSSCEQLFSSDDRVLWDYVLSESVELTQRAESGGVSDLLTTQGDSLDKSNSRLFGNLKKMVFPVSTVDLGFIQMLCILKDHFPHLNALERTPLVEVHEWLSVLSACNGSWKEVHFPAKDFSGTMENPTCESYVEFFQQNPQLKVINFLSAAVDDQDLSAICHLCVGVENLNISSCLWLRDSLHEIKNFKHLKYLDVSETTVSDGVICEVSKCCSKIVQVNISGCYKITDVGIAELVKNASKLHTLILNNVENNHANITDTGLGEIGRYGRSIKRLEMSHCPNVSDQGIISVTEGCPNIEVLDISGCLALTDKSIIDIAQNCKRLRSLNAHGCSHLSSAGINNIVSNCPMLKKLDIATCHNVKGLNFHPLHTNTRRHLDNTNSCGSNDIHSPCKYASNPTCESESNENCTTPALSDSNSTVDLGMKELEGIPLIQELLSQSRTPLTFLDLSHCSMIANDSVKQVSSHCLLLRYLSLRGCNRVQDSGITAILKGCKLLQAIDLSGTSLLQASRLTNDTLLSVGEHCRNLVMLDITKTPMISLYGIKEAIRGCMTLKRLRISLHPKHIPLYDMVQFLHEHRRHVTFSNSSLKKTIPEILEDGPNCKDALVANNFVLKFAAKAQSLCTYGML